MAKAKPRIRKTAPTVRQRLEESRLKAEEPAKPSRVRKVGSKAAAPLAKVRFPRLPDNKFTRVIRAIGRFLKPNYLLNSWAEVRQVTWPTRRETWRLTGAVFIFAAVFGGLVAGVDKILDILFKNLVLK